MNKSDTIGALAKALALAQGAMKPASKDSVNPHFKSKYADLAAVWDACRKPLADHGLSVVQTVGAEGEHVVITTMLLHESGEWIGGELRMLPRDGSPQAAGSALTFGRRYALAALVGVAPDDDDGNAAQHDASSAPRAAVPPRAPTNGNGHAAPPAVADDKAAVDDATHALAKLTSKDFAREVWASAKDNAGRLKALTSARTACAEILRVMGEGRGGEMITDLTREDAPIADRVAALVRAATGEVAPTGKG